MKRAIVLSGGGSRGAYEMGAWRTLNKLGIKYQLVTGTSIGAINAALMAQGDIDLADRLWRTITLENVMEGGLNLDFDLERYMSHGPELVAFLKRYARNRGADITPLIELIRENINEDKVRASPIDMGLVTVRFPTLGPVEAMLRDIPEGRLSDYLLASAACFPAFPVYRMDGDGFIDGGYYDNMPIPMALREGAEEIVAIDLFEKSAHPETVHRPWMTYIRPSQPLGSILLFERDVLDRNLKMGEIDALRAYGHVLGVHHSFDAGSVKRHGGIARRFSLGVKLLEDRMTIRRALTGKVSGTPFSDALMKLLPPGRKASDLDEMVVAAELLAGWAAFRQVEVYDLDAFNKLLFDKLPLENAKTLAVSASERELLLMDHPMRAAVLVAKLRAGALDGKQMRLAALLGEDMLAALYLDLFLPR